MMWIEIKFQKIYIILLILLNDALRDHLNDFINKMKIFYFGHSLCRFCSLKWSYLGYLI